MRIAIALFVATALPCRAADPATVEFFESKIRPVLVEQCYSCHAGKKTSGELSLETKATILKGVRTVPPSSPASRPTASSSRRSAAARAT